MDPVSRFPARPGDGDGGQKHPIDGQLSMAGRWWVTSSVFADCDEFHFVITGDFLYAFLNGIVAVCIRERLNPTLFTGIFTGVPVS
jgi:hypothetical protein